MLLYEYQMTKRRRTFTELDSYIRNEKLDELHFLCNLRDVLQRTVKGKISEKTPRPDMLNVLNTER